MVERGRPEPDYGNWVSARLLYVFGGLGVLFLGLSIVFTASLIVAVLSLSALAYFLYARYRFSPRGGNVQGKIRGLVLAHLDWDGKGQALDIGCGNAPLAIMLAREYPNARVTGIDYWGGVWEYSKGVCERNAQIENVKDRIVFQRADAAALPFEDGTFDAAVSNLVFHEVRSAKDKRAVIKEALRVVKKGGSFSFQDLFLMKREFGDVGSLLEAIRSWGVDSVEFLDTSRSAFIPRALRLPFMVGTIGILHGRK